MVVWWLGGRWGCHAFQVSATGFIIMVCQRLAHSSQTLWCIIVRSFALSASAVETAQHSIARLRLLCLANSSTIEPGTLLRLLCALTSRSQRLLLSRASWTLSAIVTPARTVSVAGLCGCRDVAVSSTTPSCLASCSDRRVSSARSVLRKLRPPGGVVGTKKMGGRSTADTSGSATRRDS